MNTSHPASLAMAPKHARIAVADFCAADIEGYLRYWYDSAPAVLQRMGVDHSRLPAREKMREMLSWTIGRGAASPIVTITLDGVTIGVHELTHLVPRATPPGYLSGVMHAHIWRPEQRGQGIALVSYVRAMERFFASLDLDTIAFETPRDNHGALRIKQELGMVPCGAGSIELPILHSALPTLRYEVVRADLCALRARMLQAWCRRHAMESA